MSYLKNLTTQDKFPKGENSNKSGKLYRLCNSILELNDEGFRNDIFDIKLNGRKKRVILNENKLQSLYK